MKIFVLGIPHNPTTTEFTTCAFTMKVFNLCKMMTARGHEVIHLGVEGSTPSCTRHIDVVSKSEWTSLYGNRKSTDFYDLTATGNHKIYMDKWAARARVAILDHMGKDYSSILACTWGGAQREAIKDLSQFAVESGIGYRHTWAKYRVFESYAWLHMLAGAKQAFEGNFWMDTVIPNAFEPSMFEFKEEKQNYFLFLGRLNDDKGVQLAIDIATKVGIPIKIVGQGDPKRFLKPGVEYIPPVGIQDRKVLLANARALICPTQYVEPFGGVNIEAQMSGTPVICTDWGAFPETVLQGLTGYRCKTMEQFIWAAKNSHRIKPENCRNWAYKNFSTDRIGAMYEEYFNQILTLGHEGWTAENPGRTDLDFLRKIYPPDLADLNLNSISCPLDKRNK